MSGSRLPVLWDQSLSPSTSSEAVCQPFFLPQWDILRAVNELLRHIAAAVNVVLSWLCVTWLFFLVICPLWCRGVIFIQSFHWLQRKCNISNNVGWRGRTTLVSCDYAVSRLLCEMTCVAVVVAECFFPVVFLRLLLLLFTLEITYLFLPLFVFTDCREPRPVTSFCLLRSWESCLPH